MCRCRSCIGESFLSFSSIQAYEAMYTSTERLLTHHIDNCLFEVHNLQKKRGFQEISMHTEDKTHTSLRSSSKKWENK